MWKNKAMKQTKDKKKKDQEFVSKRFQYYADPKMYRVKKMTQYGSYVLMDPDTEEVLEGGPHSRRKCNGTMPSEAAVEKQAVVRAHKISLTKCNGGLLHAWLTHDSSVRTLRVICGRTERLWPCYSIDLTEKQVHWP